jgi:hypothetical protein
MPQSFEQTLPQSFEQSLPNSFEQNTPDLVPLLLLVNLLQLPLVGVAELALALRHLGQHLGAALKGATLSSARLLRLLGPGHDFINPFRP